MAVTKRAFDPANWREQEFLSLKEVCAVLGVSRNTALAVIWMLPHVRVGRRKQYRVASKALEKWIRDQERSAVRHAAW